MALIDLDLAQDLYIGKVDEAELHAALLPFFGSAAYPTNEIQRFSSRRGSGFLELHYKAGAIRRAITDLSRTEIRELSDRIAQKLINNQTPKVAQVICFSDEWIKGAFRYRDTFQILPAGPGFPDANAIIADHPFVLQFRFISSPDPSISHMRRSPLANKYIRSLNVLSRSGIGTGPRSSGFCWCVDLEANPPKPRWMQTGYWVPTGFSYELTEYSQIDAIAGIASVPDDEYYRRGFYRSNATFSLPASVNAGLDKIFALPPADAKKFELASTWLSMVRDIVGASSSAAYIAMIASLEALLDKKAEVCPSCGQAKFSIAKKMNEFLKTFVPGASSRGEDLKEIYKIRSDLAHGLDLLLVDLGKFGISSPQQTSERMLHHGTFEMARTAVLNWLWTA